MPLKLAIGIPTCGRPRAVEACLDSIAANVTTEHRVIVVDSLITDAGRQMYARYPGVTVIAREKPIGPSEARRLIAAEADTDLVLFLDDDNLVTPGSVEALLKHLDDHPEVDIAAGAWREDRAEQRRALGQYFHFGRNARGDAVYKEFVLVDEALRLGLSAVRVDGVQATMLVRRAVFERASFDPRYDFFFELYDFFMQCRQQNVRIEALPGVIFDHRPVPYEGATLKQTSDREVDRRRFAAKWSMEPVEGRDATAGGGKGKRPPGRRSLLRRVARRIVGGSSKPAGRGGGRRNRDAD